ncbi:MAG: dephospho-CoA kinase, partial [Verrucomicrobiota bacterium]
MMVIGLTGGIGMGKSTSALLLQQRLIPVVDTDTLARQVVEPGQPAMREIEEAFGRPVIAPDGRLKREELARIVFSDETRRKELERIVHPRIRQLWQSQVALWKTESRPRCVVVIPLLFETVAAAHFDSIICVACSKASQWQRLTARGWTAEQIELRLGAQWPIQRKMDLANHVVWTEAG